MNAAAVWMEHHQVRLCLAALVVAAAFGAVVPGSGVLSAFIGPVLVLLLFATFLAVPFRAVLAGLRDGRFLATLGVVNFVVVPAVAFGLTRFVADDDPLVFGILLVLLTPCVDYVIVFTRSAGGDGPRLLAAAPLLMLAQLALLPVFLVWFLGPQALGAVAATPFIEAFVLYIALPLGGAVVVQTLAPRRRVARGVDAVMASAMVPLLMATLFLVVASHVRVVTLESGSVLRAAPLYVAFAVIMVLVGVGATRALRMEVGAARAVVFSGVTRNSLVVLPLALATSTAFPAAPVLVVTQTIVELLVMVAMVRLVPRLVPAATTGPREAAAR